MVTFIKNNGDFCKKNGDIQNVTILVYAPLYPSWYRQDFNPFVLSLKGLEPKIFSDNIS